MTDASKVRELTAEVEQLCAELDQRDSALERQAAELVKRQTELDKANRFRARMAGFATGSAVRVLLSEPLVNSLKAWLRARTLRDPLPVDETAEVLAAVLRRVVRVGWVGLAVASLPIVVLVWQSFMMREQNAAMREQNAHMREQNAAIRTQNEQIATQNETMQRQVDQQAADTLIVRRAQLLETIYDCEVEELAAGSEDDESKAPKVEGDSKPVCQPKAHIRARQEAALAFVKIERDREARPNLDDTDLRRADLGGADLRDTTLRDANLRDANLTSADLSGASIFGANLTGAFLNDAVLTDAMLFRADLSGAILFGARLEGATLLDADLEGADLRDADLNSANLRDANLTDATLRDANLRDADLIGAILSGAELRHAKNLTQEQINSAFGNAETALPEGLERPPHWE